MNAGDLEMEAIKYWSESNLPKARDLHAQARKTSPELDWIRHNDIWFIEPDFNVDNTFLEKKSLENTKYKNAKISLLVVSYSRPEGAMRIASTARVTAKRPELIEILICTDESDPLLERYKILPELNVHIIPEHRTSDKWNYLYSKSTGDIIFMVCDDVIFESWNWDEVLRNLWPDDGMAVMFTDDGNGKELLEFPIISRKIADILGYCAYPKLDHAGLDAWWSFIGKKLNRYYYLAKVFRHRHQHYEVSTVHKRETRKPLNLILEYGHDLDEEVKKLVI